MPDPYIMGAGDAIAFALLSVAAMYLVFTGLVSLAEKVIRWVKK